VLILKIRVSHFHNLRLPGGGADPELFSLGPNFCRGDDEHQSGIVRADETGCQVGGELAQIFKYFSQLFF
jgi:hypothetical protein